LKNCCGAISAVGECCTPGQVIWPGASACPIRALGDKRTTRAIPLIRELNDSPGFFIFKMTKPTRLPIGTEHIDDIFADFQKGFDAGK